MKIEERFQQMMDQIEEEVDRAPSPDEQEIIRRIFNAGLRAGSEIEREACAENVEGFQKLWNEREMRTVPPVSPLHIAEVVRARRPIDILTIESEKPRKGMLQ